MASNSSSRERGTLLTTLPKAWWIILLGHVVCTAFGTFLSQYSLHNIEYLDIGIGFKVALGVASSMVALLHTDAFLFLVSFTIPVSAKCKWRLHFFIDLEYSVKHIIIVSISLLNISQCVHVAANCNRCNIIVSWTIDNFSRANCNISCIATFIL